MKQFLSLIVLILFAALAHACGQAQQTVQYQVQAAAQVQYAPTLAAPVCVQQAPVQYQMQQVQLQQAPVQYVQPQPQQVPMQYQAPALQLQVQPAYAPPLVVVQQQPQRGLFGGLLGGRQGRHGTRTVTKTKTRTR